MDSDNTLPLEAAPHNCIPCKKNKRRCDKKLPSCSLCMRYVCRPSPDLAMEGLIVIHKIRMRRVCDYPEALEPISQEEVARLQSRIVDLEALVSRLSGYNAQNSSVLIHGEERPISNSSQNLSSEYLLQTFFLDSDILKSGTFSAPRVNVLVPNEIQQVLGDRSAIAYATSRYFQCINPWMPIISKIKLNRLIETPTIELAADLALLLLCMMLLLELPVDKGPSQSTIYNLARQFRFALDMAGLHSLMTVQAGLLISVYELGHAILPAAYLSIANCAREGIALGIHHRDAPQMLHRPSNWISWEERQRVWWFVLILDRSGVDFLLVITRG